MIAPFKGPRRFLTASHLGLLCWLCAVVALVAQQRVGEGAGSGQPWEILEDCELIDDAGRDGDNFHARYRGRQYVFRLYFVDAPEIEATFPDRITEQAAYFGISTNDVVRLGREASAFTREWLAGKFTVVTRWQNARGRGKHARFYAMVRKEGRDLSAQLVARGYARIHGLKANWPDETQANRFAENLKQIEREALAQRRGGWNGERFSRAVARDGGRSIPAATGVLPTILDLNRATLDQLVHIPGIGKTLAERIISRRPFKSVAELKEVRGIGEKTYQKLKAYFKV